MNDEYWKQLMGGEEGHGYWKSACARFSIQRFVYETLKEGRTLRTVQCAPYWRAYDRGERIFVDKLSSLTMAKMAVDSVKREEV